MQVTVVIHLKYTLPQLDPRPAANVVTFLNDWPPRFSRIFLVLPEITKPLGRKFAISNLETAAEKRLKFSLPFCRFALWLAAYVIVGLPLAMFVQSFVKWFLSATASFLIALT
jgi:hypothetical protein